MAALRFCYLVLALCSLSVTVSADSGKKEKKKKIIFMNYDPFFSIFYFFAVHLSLECGSPFGDSTYVDKNSITWTGDDKYIKGGEIRYVKSDDRVLQRMRVFTAARKKNCYHIDTMRRGRVLVRATFYYGNYDNKSSPPTFDLHFDGNFWKTVVTSISEVVSYEVIYVMRRDWITVCLARTKDGQFPFISTLEIRSLDWFMYTGIPESYPLFLRRRDPFDYGIIRCIHIVFRIPPIPISIYGRDKSFATVMAVSNTFLLRYPDDPYDRIWSTEIANLGQNRFYSDAYFYYQHSSDVVPSRDEPPPRVLRYGVYAPTPNSSLQIFTLHNYETPAYVNLYFTEFRYNRQLNETRSFTVFKDDKQISLPIWPPYGNFTELTFPNLSVSGTSTFSVVPTTYSTLAPAISALEIFLIGDMLTDGTEGSDALGLIDLQKGFDDVLREWRGDPCLPAPFSYDWIVCNYSYSRPRITAISLGSFGLSGPLPDFESMHALQTIDFHNNSLRGPIPDFLGKLPNLKILNLENNHFSGSIPASLLNNKGLTLMVSGNPDLSSCTRMKINIIVQILFGTIISSIMLHAWA
ncbi:PREDICTED: putative leucine-rich repeat receptor-like protein kinase At2g19210 [Erythranthe guttata]|uniref:putative leucine-rich repeat receptor-like protein kinase At2g19210 n=1 Tax=Erythranthe guttata TaxID=4155 RepID=UPI00064D8367|nr:PREDICTED: putative leucine-rich repeat receptor-like protein kinase At2g19210 [Erythranthe guttata]|eukprot:XP_012838192.1 PREDICTED: putative leucine-rich repeat receptor-like protein kinase At2g19210 [Erythranthe guttata]